MINKKEYAAVEVPFKVLCESRTPYSTPYPYLRSAKGNKVMYGVSPYHGRSYVVAKCSDNYIVSKGNGLAFSHETFIHTGEMGGDTWGLLLKQDAIRDFVIGQEIASLGIKTNRMEYVIELNENIILGNGIQQKPVLLQYTVECPYRICDITFMQTKQISNEIAKWKKFNDKNYKESYFIAANILIKNLRILHDNGILHNAIHSQNYTWALELLDFELASSRNYPYTNEDDQRHVKDLFPREIIQTYEIINYIAWCLGEEINYVKIDNMFKDYGFDLSEYSNLRCHYNKNMNDETF